MKTSPKMLAAMVFMGGLVVIGYQAYELNRFRIEIRDMPVIKLAPLSNASTSPQMLLSPLSKQHLMGNPAQTALPPVVVKPAIDPNLKLELVGTIRGALESKDSALIQAKGKETKRYYVGDMVEGGAILQSVGEDVVTLQRGGAVESLGYVKNAAPTPITPAAPVQPVVTAPQQGAANQTNVPQPNGNSGPLSLRERLKKRANPVNQPGEG